MYEVQAERCGHESAVEQTGRVWYYYNDGLKYQK